MLRGQRGGKLRDGLGLSQGGRVQPDRGAFYRGNSKGQALPQFSAQAFHKRPAGGKQEEQGVKHRYDRREQAVEQQDKVTHWGGKPTYLFEADAAFFFFRDSQGRAKRAEYLGTKEPVSKETPIFSASSLAQSPLISSFS